MNKTFHEKLFRGSEIMAKLKEPLVTICGAGALGANISESLARTGLERLRVIDFDRVEEQNLSTQPYQLDDIGSLKVDTLGTQIYRSTEVEVETISKRLDERNVRKLLKGSDLVLDCFDNSPSRKIVTEHCAEFGLACLHTGMADAYAEVIWNDKYRVPSSNQDDVCDYPLARNLVTLAVAVTCETVIAYFAEGSQNNWSVTLGDLSVRTLPV